jgi:hypothetical protein
MRQYLVTILSKENFILGPKKEEDNFISRITIKLAAPF